jgi:hypothetical protein
MSYVFSLSLSLNQSQCERIVGRALCACAVKNILQPYGIDVSSSMHSEIYRRTRMW